MLMPWQWAIATAVAQYFFVSLVKEQCNIFKLIIPPENNLGSTVADARADLRPRLAKKSHMVVRAGQKRDNISLDR